MLCNLHKKDTERSSRFSKRELNKNNKEKRNRQQRHKRHASLPATVLKSISSGVLFPGCECESRMRKLASGKEVFKKHVILVAKAPEDTRTPSSVTCGLKSGSDSSSTLPGQSRTLAGTSTVSVANFSLTKNPAPTPPRGGGVSVC